MEISVLILSAFFPPKTPGSSVRPPFLASIGLIEFASEFPNQFDLRIYRKLFCAISNEEDDFFLRKIFLYSALNSSKMNPSSLFSNHHILDYVHFHFSLLQ